MNEKFEDAAGKVHFELGKDRGRKRYKMKRRMEERERGREEKKRSGSNTPIERHSIWRERE